MSARPNGRWYCSPCSVARVKAWNERQLSDPEAATALRAKRAEYMREYRAGNPDYAEAGREANRQYKRRQRARCTERQRLRRAGISGTEHVDRAVVLERDKGICGICGEPVDRGNFHVDHIVPLSRGGEHSYANTQVAHPRCNQVKYDRAPT